MYNWAKLKIPFTCFCNFSGLLSIKSTISPLTTKSKENIKNISYNYFTIVIDLTCCHWNDSWSRNKLTQALDLYTKMLIVYNRNITFCRTVTGSSSASSFLLRTDDTLLFEWMENFSEQMTQAVRTDGFFFWMDDPSCLNGCKFFLNS